MLCEAFIDSEMLEWPTCKNPLNLGKRSHGLICFPLRDFHDHIQT